MPPKSERPDLDVGMLDASNACFKQEPIPVNFRMRMSPGVDFDLVERLRLATGKWLAGMHAFRPSAALIRAAYRNPSGFAVVQTVLSKDLVQAIRPDAAQWVVDMADLGIEGITLVEVFLPEEPKPTTTIIHGLPANLDPEGLARVLTSKGCQVLSAAREVDNVSGLLGMAVKVVFAPNSVVPQHLNWSVKEGEVCACRVDIVSMLPRPPKPATYASAASGPARNAAPQTPPKRGFQATRQPAQTAKKPSKANAELEAKAAAAKAKLERQKQAQLERERTVATRLAAEEEEKQKAAELKKQTEAKHKADAEIAADVAAAAVAAAVARTDTAAEEHPPSDPPLPHPPAPAVIQGAGPPPLEMAMPEPDTSESEPEDAHMEGAMDDASSNKRRKTSAEHETSGAQAGAADHQNA